MYRPLIIFSVFFFFFNSNLLTMEKKPYHHVYENGLFKKFRNFQGSPERNKNFKWSYKKFREAKKKINVIVPKDFVQAMKPGSVVIDMAAESGGNVEGSKPGEVVNINGVQIVGTGNWPNEVPLHASQMFSNNLFNFVSEFWNSDTKSVELDFENDLIDCVITHDGSIVNETIAKFYNQR